LVAHFYSNKKVVLTSKHDKLKLIKPAFDGYVGCEVIEANLDTDQLGTFSGEIERKAPPRETAIQKARLGMKETGLLIGVASEGSIGPDPVIPFIHSNIEHLVWVDDERDIVISETFRSFEITAATLTTTPGQDLTSFLEKADFPNHALIARPNTQIKSDCIKGITDLNQLIEAIELCSRISPNGFVVIESDLRAMHSPSRQKNIAEVAKLLAIRVSTLCPKCDLPGLGRVDFARGLDCSECGLNNPEAISQEILGCVKCDHKELGKVIANTLEPAQCNFCNP
jgi:hypothetical protein